MSDGSLGLEIRVGSDGMVKGLKIATTNVADAAALMATSLAKIGQESHNAKEHSEGFTDVLREFKSEATQNSRVAKFFANDLAAIIPGADGAAQSMRSLIAIGMGGASPFAAIELGVLIFEKVNEKIHEAEAEAKALADAYRHTARSAGDAFEAVERGLHPVTQTQAAWGAEVRKVRDENRKLDDQIGELLKKSGGMRDFFAGITPALLDAVPAVAAIAAAVEAITTKGDGKKDFLSVESIDDQIKKLHELQEANLQGLESKEPQKEKVGAEERTKIERDANLAIANERETISTQLHAKLRALAVTGASQEAQLEAQLATDIEKLRLERDVATRDTKLKNEKEADEKIRELNNEALAEKKRAIDEEIKALVAASAKKIEIAQRAIRIQTEADTASNDQRKYDQQLKAYQTLADLDDQYAARKAASGDRRTAEHLLRIQQEADKEAVLLNQARQNNLISETEFQAKLKALWDQAGEDQDAVLKKQHTKWVKDFIHPLESSFASAIRSMVDGTKSFAAAMNAMMMGVINSMIDALVRLGIEAVTEALLEHAASGAKAIGQVTQNAAIAGSAVASQIAATPGFLGAVPAGAAMAAAVEATFLPMASAAGGYDIPSGINPILQTHAREMVLPEQYADVIRGLAGSGAGGASEIHNHYHYWSALDGPSVRKFIASDEFVRGFSEARRNGRIR